MTMKLVDELRRRMADADAEEQKVYAEAITRIENWSPEYSAYHTKVVDACAALMGENQRQFFDEQCDYFEEFERNEEPDEVAWAQWEALT
jgi:hypothetical protein